MFDIRILLCGGISLASFLCALENRSRSCDLLAERLELYKILQERGEKSTVKISDRVEYVNGSTQK